MAQRWNENIHEVTFAKETAGAAMAYSLNPDKHFQLLDYRLANGTSPATSENLTVTINSKYGSAYDTIISTTDMNNVDDLYEDFDNMKCQKGDTIDFAWANTNTVTYGLVVTYRRLI